MMVYAFGIGEVPISVSGVSERGRGGADGAGCGRRLGGDLRLKARAASWACAGRWATHGRSKRAAGGDVVVVAGGIGLAPLRMLIRHVIASRQDFSAFSVLYGARTPGELLYLDELESWRNASRGGGHRRPRRQRLARSGRGGSKAGQCGPLRRGLNARVRLRARGDDGLHRLRRYSRAAFLPSGSTSRWSGTWTVASGSAATASSVRR